MAAGNGGSDKSSKRNLVIAFVVLFVITGILAVLGGLWADEMQKQQLGRLIYLYDGPAPHEGILMMFVLFWGTYGSISLLVWLLNTPARRRQREVCAKMRGLTGNGAPASDFLAARGALRQSDFTGVYVLHNVTKDMYYVGQSVKVINRVGQHLTGHGNGNVYADFKYGDEFEVSTVSLVESGYGSLNDLERDTIAAYDAYNHGYNRTAGNAR